MKTKILMLAALMVVSAQSFSALPKSSPLSTQVKKAKLVFQGKVVDIDYRDSDDSSKVPHTYVTYQIEKILKGNYKAHKITLRFLGGVDSEDDFVEVSGYPLFDMGDRDILMVEGNGTDACPLVDCELGRFRLIGGKTYGELGQKISLKKGLIVRGLPVKLKEVSTHYLKPKQFGKKVVITKDESVFTNKDSEKGRFKKPVTIRPTKPNKPGRFNILEGTELGQKLATAKLLKAHLPAKDFSTYTMKIIKRIHSPGELKRLPAVQSISIKRPFKLSIGKILSPKKQFKRIVALPKNRAEKQELQLYKANGNSPVIR
ncbi:MAG: hypothetical protein HOE90_18560 [Bacteriovoracaceae bacterium]|nr:hypothetical protein [Bacteriovoracaceae bacterium]